MKLTVSDIAAFYAAIVATGALYLEVRRWFDSGVKLRINVSHQYDIPDVRLPAITAEVASIGDAPTTVTGLEIWGYRSLYHAILGLSPTRLEVFGTVIFSTPQGLPHQLAPGGRWAGNINFDTNQLSTPQFSVAYFAVRTTRYEKPSFKRIRNWPIVTEDLRSRT